LYFGSMRPDGLGASDIWVSQRASVHNPWEPPLNPRRHRQYPRRRKHSRAVSRRTSALLQR
jgi:hypothetical protein